MKRERVRMDKGKKERDIKKIITNTFHRNTDTTLQSHI